MAPGDMVVVSGAGTGIGRAVARRLAGDGFHVLAVGRRREPLERLAKELAPHLDVASADLATVAGATSVAESVRAAERGCAGVVAAAGGVSPHRADGLDGVRQDWLASFGSNVLTAVLLVEAVREEIERSGGRVVLLSSVAAMRGSGGGAYGAVKAALHGFALTWPGSSARTAARPTLSRRGSFRIPSSGPGGSPAIPGASARRRPWSAGRGRRRRWPR